METKQKRDDGFHEIETVMAPINLFDQLVFVPTSDEMIELSIRNRLPGSLENTIPGDSDNLVFRAVTLLKNRVACGMGASIKLIKQIPVQAGLGGGSSDAAAALVAANRAWNLKLSNEALQRLGAELGSDVPFFIESSAKVCFGRGELLKPLENLTRLHLVVAKPFFGLSTPDVYSATIVPGEANSADSLIEAWTTGKIEKMGQLLFNQLENSAQKLSTEIKASKHHIEQLPNCIGSLMSGSGSSCFGLFRRHGDAMRAARILRNRRKFESVFCCQTI